ncbi:MAG: helix-turn-helix transcriptional regulator [Clostridia bacterium]|nr:helix-turn-helix transcriptional regulator [Clostridia bacterium]
MYGKEIKEIRKTCNYTQKQVSEGTGLPQNTISWIESDKGIPNAHQCVLLADFYGVTVDELLGRDLSNKKLH